MSCRTRSRVPLALRLMTATAALFLVATTALAQEPPPAGSDPSAAPPPAAGQPSTAPPPAAGQPTTSPSPTAGQPSAAPPPPAGQPGAAPPPGPAPFPRPRRYRDYQLQLAVGGEFFAFGSELVGNGPALKISSLWTRWWGPFMLGGGTSFYYSYMLETKEPKDYIHQITINADAMIGGGIPGKFAVYVHLLLGAGFADVYDGETQLHVKSFWIRAVGGVGAYYQLNRRLSLGVLIDLGWPGLVSAMATVGFHWGGPR